MTRAIFAFSLAVYIEELFEEGDGGCYLKINLAEDLEVANIGHRVRPYILRVQIEIVKEVSEEFRPGWSKPSEYVISKDYNLIFSRGRDYFSITDSPSDLLLTR